jgi:hypothetical protein
MPGTRGVRGKRRGGICLRQGVWVGVVLLPPPPPPEEAAITTPMTTAVPKAIHPMVPADIPA